MTLGRLMGVSFDIRAAPGLAIKPLRAASDAPASWGLAWYPDDDAAAVAVKEPADLRESATGDMLEHWERFRTTSLVLYTRAVAKRSTQQDTQPFARSYSRQDVVFVHSGDLSDDHRERLAPLETAAFEPLGRTDSEFAFCWLLERMRAFGARSVADVGWTRWVEWLRHINAGGCASLILTDGRDMLAYRDSEGVGTMFVARRVPPHAQACMESAEAMFDVGDPHAANRSHVIFATEAFGEADWVEVAPGQLLVARRGQIMWQSDASSERELSVAQTVAVIAPSDTEHRTIDDSATSAVTQPPVAVALPQAQALQEQPPAMQPPPPERVLTVTHQTAYTYEEAVESSAHLLRLRPVWDAGQQLLEYDLTVSPEVHRKSFEDVFGNHAVQFRIDVPYNEFRVQMRAKVRLVSSGGAEVPHEPVTIPLVWMPWQRQLMHAYLLPPELPETQLQELSEYAMSFVERQDYDLVEVLNDINTTIYRDFQYLSGSTTLETTPYDVFVNRKGVCQDFANLFICLARLLSVPARYRVGYIFTGANYENKVQSDASHAWAEVYLPTVGWLGFDPTNGCRVGLDHIRVAAGRNYRDATPTSGTIFKGGQSETLSVAVEVLEGPSE